MHIIIIIIILKSISPCTKRSRKICWDKIYATGRFSRHQSLTVFKQDNIAFLFPFSVWTYSHKRPQTAVTKGAFCLQLTCNVKTKGHTSTHPHPYTHIYKLLFSFHDQIQSQVFDRHKAIMEDTYLPKVLHRGTESETA